MAEKQIAPYGSWPSPITTELITQNVVRLGQTAVDPDGDAVYWEEARPAEGGRHVVVRWAPGGEPEALTPPPYNVRSRVHEYGGGAFWVSRGELFFVNFDDQRIYRQTAGEAPHPITPPNVDLRYADGVVDWQRARIICVREDHTVAGGEPLNALVGVALGGGDEGGEILVMGDSFYASPRLSPDGNHLAWLAWNHPQMPWQGTELWVGAVDGDGRVTDRHLVAGGPDESLFQPEWGPEGAGALYFISDRSGWWNLYRQPLAAGAEAEAVALLPREREFGLPQWQFGRQSYGLTAGGALICLYLEQGEWRMAMLAPAGPGGELTPMVLPYNELSHLAVGADSVAVVAGGPAELPALLRIDLKTQQVAVLRRAGELPLDAGTFSLPEEIAFPTGDGERAYAYYYPPHNPHYQGPAEEKPPLLVMSHGGPTSRTPSHLQLRIQFWTSRGFAVLDVNYRGSTGYGRAYRQKLDGQWGLVDVEDCIAGARYLIERGDVDPERLAIRGGSAGGYTTLCALTFHDFFHAGASYFGVSDLEALTRETHKFESRYLDSLVGPYPEMQELYRQRSPVHFVEQLSCPIIFFQGLEDAVVPTAQAELMVDALRRQGLPVAYLPFAGEQHGFRRAETIRRALEAELYFYSRIFGFEPADEIEPVTIENLPE
ncbi:MAG: S9 family peptidase [Candidatus Promineifilaceae bacterium]|nr:S9 family peptidase [Candidatus Promineifilaceae bacterium]